MKKLKILHTVEFYHPIHGGSQEVVKRISEGLVKKGHDVTVVTSFASERGGVKELNGVKIREFKVQGKLAYEMKGEIEEYQKFLLNENFDIMLNYSAQQWTFDALFPILDKLTSKKVLVPCGFSGLYLKEFISYYNKLPEYLNYYDQLVFLSHDYRDINFCKKAGFKNISIIPNGCALEEFKDGVSANEEKALRLKLGIPENDFLVLHVGSHTGIKGHDEAIKIFKKANLPNSSLVIVGNVFDQNCAKKCLRNSNRSKLFRKYKLKKNSIFSIQIEREDTVNLYKSANVFLFPSNVECSPIVLFEAMASKSPFLATDVGNSVEIQKFSMAGEIIKTKLDYHNNSYANSFADVEDGASRLRALYFDQSLRDFYAVNGYNTWISGYTWENITNQYESLYSTLVLGSKDG